jgi:hypothetical protein
VRTISPKYSSSPRGRYFGVLVPVLVPVPLPVPAPLWLAPAPVVPPAAGLAAGVAAEPDLTLVLLLAAVPALGLVD